MSWFNLTFWKSCFKMGISLKPPPEDVSELLQTTALKVGQINFLYKRFCLIGKYSATFPPKYLTKFNFLNIGHLDRNPILSVLLKAMFRDNKKLTFVEFARFLDLFQVNILKTTSEGLNEIKNRKIHLLFNMWDSDSDGVLSENDLIHIIHKLFGDIISKRKVLSVVEAMMHEMAGADADKILFEDFKKSLDAFDMTETLVTKIREF